VLSTTGVGVTGSTCATTVPANAQQSPITQERMAQRWQASGRK